MTGRLKNYFMSVRENIRQIRHRRLTQDLPHYSATLKESDGSSRRQFFSCLMSNLLAVFSVLLFSKAARAEKLQEWMDKSGFSKNPDFIQSSDRYRHMLAGHTNVSHTNAHNNSGGRHVNVPSQVGHFDSTPPHSNTHLNSPHVNQTVPDKTPDPGKGKTGKEKA